MYINAKVDGASQTIVSQNNCLMLCDWYPVLTFYTSGQDWRYRLVDEDQEMPVPEDADQAIYCWN